MNNKKLNLTEEFRQGKYNIFSILDSNIPKNQLPLEKTIMEPKHPELKSEPTKTAQSMDNNSDNQSNTSGIAVLKINIENKFKEYNNTLQFKDEIIAELYLKIDELNNIISLLDNINTMLSIEAEITKWKDIPNGTPVTVKFARKFLNEEL